MEQWVTSPLVTQTRKNWLPNFFGCRSPPPPILPHFSSAHPTSPPPGRTAKQARLYTQLSTTGIYEPLLHKQADAFIRVLFAAPSNGIHTLFKRCGLTLLHSNLAKTRHQTFVTTKIVPLITSAQPDIYGIL